MTPLMLSNLVGTFETSMVYSAFKSILEEFGDPVTVGWLVTAYMLVAASGAAIVGRLGDMFSRRRVLLIVIVLAIVGSIISATAPTLSGIIAGRAIQGFAVTILPLCLGLIREHIPEKQVPFCIGLLIATSSIGTTIGLIGGGYIVDVMDWRAIFYASALFGMVAFFFVVVLVPAARVRSGFKQIDIVGGILFAPSVAALLFAVSTGSRWGWFDPWIVSLLFLGIAGLVFWALYEYRHVNPLINVRLLADRNIGMVFLCLTLSALGSYQVLQFFMLLLQQPVWTGAGLSVSATMAGVYKVPSTIATIIGAPIAGWLCGRWGSRSVIALGMGFTVCAWLGVMFNMSNLPWLVVMLALCGFGVGISYTGISAAIVANTPSDRISEATGFMVVIRALMAAVGAQLLVICLATVTVTDPTQGPGTFPAPAAYTVALLMLTIFSAAAVAAALSMPRRSSCGSKGGSL